MLPQAPRERGSTLIVCLLLIILLFGFASSVGILADARSKSVRDEIRESMAFYLAEGGLEHAMWEIEVQLDLGQDGVGELVRATPTGGQLVTSNDLGGGLIEILSTGTCEGSDVVLRGLVRRTPQTRFPQGGVSIVGSADKTKVQFKKHLGLSIDGGDTAGITIADPTLYNDIADEVVQALDAGTITPTSIQGDLWNSHGGDDDDDDDEDDEDSTMISMAPSAGGLQVADLENFYDAANASIAALVPTAQTYGDILGSGTDTLTYGTAENPAIVHFDGKVALKQSDSITGFGTLIISNEVSLSDSAVINWTGNVIVYADAAKSSKLILGGSSDLAVAGNLAVFGEGLTDVEVSVAAGASVAVDGAATFGTYQDSSKGKKIMLEVAGGLQVDGLLSVIGAKVDANLMSGSNTVVNGMMQIGVTDPDNKLSLKFDGNLDVAKNDDEILAGAQALSDLGATLDLAEISELIVTEAVEDLTWGRVH